MKLWPLLLCLLLLSSFVPAHEGEDEEEEPAPAAEPSEQLIPADASISLDPVLWASSIILLTAALSIAFQSRMGELHKKVAFIVIALSVILSTSYLLFSIVSINTSSLTGGPVHWHADFEVWACGERLELQQSSGMSNRVGTSIFHHHNDYRIHVEGAITDYRQASLGKFFEVIGGDFHADELSVILKDGTRKTWMTGMACPDGRAGEVRLYVNGERNYELDDYVISPHETVPPGDVLKIAFEQVE